MNSVPGVVVPQNNGTVLQIGTLGLTSGNLLVYGGTALALLLGVLLPDNNPLKSVAMVAGIGGAVFIGSSFVAASGIH
jgi:hypothetical protein